MTMSSSSSYFEKKMRDDYHLQTIFNSLTIRDNYKILDLGTGTGYVAIPLAWNHPSATVVGLDIIDSELFDNQLKAEQLHLPNLSYQTYEGEIMPFEDNSFDLIISRYSLHHFSNIQKTFEEIKRVLKDGGTFFLSDPTPNTDDTTGFIDDIMQLKQDSHVKFYTQEEFKQLARLAGFHDQSTFTTTLRFASKSRLEKFLLTKDSFDPAMITSYQLEPSDIYLYMTLTISNITFVNL